MEIVVFFSLFSRYLMFSFFFAVAQQRCEHKNPGSLRNNVKLNKSASSCSKTSIHKPNSYKHTQKTTSPSLKAKAEEKKNTLRNAVKVVIKRKKQSRTIYTTTEKKIFIKIKPKRNVVVIQANADDLVKSDCI